MDGAFLELIKVSPVAAVLLVIVIMFIRYIQSRDSLQEARDTFFRDMLHAIGEANRKEQEEQNKKFETALEKNSKALEENTAALKRFSQGKR